MNGQQPLNVRYPGGCYLGFNAAIDRRAAEQLVFLAGDAHRNGFKELHLCMTSVGGLLDHAYYAYNFLDGLPLKIVTHNLGNILSAANLIFLCGDERYAVQGSGFFFHQTSYDPPKEQITEKYLLGRLTALRNEDQRSASIVAAKTGRTLKEVQGWMASETVMDAATASANGVIHGIKDFKLPQDALFQQVLI